MQNTRRGILEYLRDHGSGTVDDLAKAVGLAPVTVRHHLGVLRRRGLLRTATESVGRGRPHYVFSLSPAGAEVLADDRYQALALRLLDAMKGEDDGGRTQGFFRDMAAEIAEAHRGEFENEPIESRMSALASILSDEGFTVRWECANGGFLLHQLGCPYHELSDEHAEVCLMDLELIRRVSGGRVSRESWRRTGDEVCVVRVQVADDG
jgi:predicted ArsR family transcriptional regulator